MADLPEEIFDRINEICDDFERSARRGNQPKLAPFLERFPEAYRVHVLEWLVPVEMELLQAGTRDARKWTKSVEHYLLKFPSLADPKAVGCLQSIVAAEFRLKQALDNPPDIPATVHRFPHLAESLAPQLRSELYQLRPVVIKIGIGSRDESSVPLNKVIQFGRQRSGEPPPIKLSEVDAGKCRLIIARRDETAVGRQHATCQLVALGRVAVHNHSAKSLVAVNSTERIGYDKTWEGEPPFLLHVGPKVFHIETT